MRDFPGLRRLAAGAGRSFRSRIRWKIVAPYVVLTLIVAAAGTFIATRFVAGSLEDRFDNQLAEAARVASDSVVRRERQHLGVLRSIVFTIGVPEQTASRDSLRLRHLVEPVVANAGAEYVEIIGLDGRRLLGLQLADRATLRYEPLAAPIDRGDIEVVRKVLDHEADSSGDKFAQIIDLEAGPALYTGGPILDGDRLVGVALVGSAVDGLLPVVKHEALADVTFYGFDGSVLASTLDHSDAATADLTPATDVATEGITGFREVKSLYGRDFDLVYGELRVREETVGVYSIALPSAFISSAASTARWSMTAVFATATVAVLAVGLIVAHGVTAPLLRLVRTARAVSDGDLTARSGVTGRDEVGTLATSFDAMTARLAQQHLATIGALSSAIDARDPYTAGHSIRVGQLAVEIGRVLELPRRDLQLLEIGGYLHDIGKIGIRDNVLLKEGPLTEEERALIEEHPRIGIRIVERVELAQEVLDFISGHHEKLDGSGYPSGRGGEAISIFSRIGAVSDIYDALTTDRPYRRGLSVEQAIGYVKDEASTGRLDQRAVKGLIQVMPTWERRRRTDHALRGFSLEELEELAVEVS